MKYIVGIDEVGRGPLAGPVAVGAFVALTEDALKRFRGVKESKQLTHEAREKWYARLLEEKTNRRINFAVTFISEKVIDTRGLSFAIKTALATALERLSLSPVECLVLLDGGLKAPSHYPHQKTIIKGDEKEKVIALASIAAKVERDRQMIEYAKKYPDYGFHEHKGYATARHCLKIRELGICPLHRKSFLKKFNLKSDIAG